VAIEGRIDPWVVILPGNAEYVVRISMRDLTLADGSNLAGHRSEDWVLRITFVGKVAFDYAPGGRRVEYSITQNGVTSIPSWTGTLTTELSHHASK
jgi:hypothetical protein